MQSLCSLQILYVMVTFSLSKIILKEEGKKKPKRNWAKKKKKFVLIAYLELLYLIT